jgi:hypothetical protein
MKILSLLLLMFLCGFTSMEKQSIIIVSHLDDEVLWLLPFIDETDRVYIASLPATNGQINIAKQYLKNPIFTRGVTSYREYIDTWLNREKRQQFITEHSYDLMLRDIISDPRVTTIYTHNPWGEYGHVHHRQVSAMVRKLAVEYGKDVWCPNIVVWSPDHDPVYDRTSHSMQSEWKLYDTEKLEHIKEYYVNEPVNQTFPINYWTWDNSAPTGWQEYFLAVSNGVDQTGKETKQLNEAVLIYGN